jgi:tRNA nucleotidyltransferase/poly(A) polymerase
MKKFKLYQVGGSVRDEILGIKSKDIDYTAVPSEKLLKYCLDVNKMFELLVNELEIRGFEIFLKTPSCFTIRAKFPTTHKNKGLVADFVMARKEIGYLPGTRQPIVIPGTLRDDLERRDFTLNALAKDDEGNIIDYFDGQWALESKMLLTPLDSKVTMLDDPLRLLRAFRFSITKGFTISPRIWETIHMDSVIDKLEQVVSQERIREEVFKMMKYDTVKSLELLAEIQKLQPRLIEIMFGRGMWLKPTTEI